MLRKLASKVTLALCLAGLAYPGTTAEAQDDTMSQVHQDSQGWVYTVWYQNVRFPGRWHVYGTYSHWNQAAHVRDFVNSFPEYRAYIAADVQP
jgi:hypothetical protein